MSLVEIRRDPVEEIAEEFAARLRRGERPALTEYTDRYPELADEIRELFPAMVVMEKFGSIAGPITGPRAPAPATDSAGQLGDFRILREVGRGGMGIVYEAIQESLGRHVALKVLAGPRATGPFLERFHREAKAAARLHHTNIVPVFGVGEAGGTHFYAMQFIRGHGLDLVLAEVRRMRGCHDANATHDRTAAVAAFAVRNLLTGARNPASVTDVWKDHPTTDLDTAVSGPAADRPRINLSEVSLAGQSEQRYFREAARLCVQAADGLHYAHGQGVLHRDIKPSNLLLDAQGTVWITDFGLAKADDSHDLTGSGDIVGTVRYMAPERFRGEADARSDVYALGITLYELLTLKPAYDDSDRLRLVDRVAKESPPPPRSIDPRIPRDLETIVLKSVARDPADRYATAGALAEDLRRFLADRSILARRHSQAEQAWRWCRRNPAIATLGVAVAACLVAVAVVSSVASWNLGRALQKTQAAELEGRRELFESYLAQAEANRLSRRGGQRFTSLARLADAAKLARELNLPPDRIAELRTAAIATLILPDLAFQSIGDMPPDTGRINFTPDGQTYARVNGLTATIRRVADDSEIARVEVDNSKDAVHLDPTGRRLLVHHFDDDKGMWLGITLWAIDRQPTLRIMDESRRVTAAHFERSGRNIAVGYRDGSIVVINSEDGKILDQIPPATFIDCNVALHPSEEVVAVTMYRAHAVELRELPSGRILATLPRLRPGGLFPLAWSPDGRTLAVSINEGARDANGEIQNFIAIYPFDARTRQVGSPRILPVHADCGHICFDPSGDHLALTGWGSINALIDVNNGQSLFQTHSFGPLEWNQRFDHDGRRILGVWEHHHSHRLGFLEVADGHECRTHRISDIPSLPEHEVPAIHPGGRLAALTRQDGVTLFNLHSGQVLAHLKTGQGAVAFDAGGSLFTGSLQGCFRWPITIDGAQYSVGPPERLPLPPGTLQFGVSRDGQVLGWAMFAGYGMGANAGGWVVHPDRPGEAINVAPGINGKIADASPDGQWVMFENHARDVRIHDARTGALVWKSAEFGRGQFSPDGRWLMTSCDGGRLYSVGTWQPGPQLGPGWPRDMTADGKVAVLALPEGVFRLVAVADGRELARVSDPDHLANLAVFSPDGTKLIADVKFGVRVWDLREIRRGLAALDLDWNAPAYPESPIDKAKIEVIVHGDDLLADPAKMRDHEHARHILRLTLNPFDAEANLGLARSLYQGGRIADAVKHFTLVLSVRPDSKTARYNRALVMYRLGRPNDALADLNEYLNRYPKDSGAVLLRGQTFRRLDLLCEAIDDFTAVIARYPNDSSVYEQRAACFAAVGDQGSAAEDYRKSETLRKITPIELNNRAWSLVAQANDSAADLEKGLDFAQRAAAADPGNPIFQNTLGVALYRNNRIEEAIESLEKSLAGPNRDADPFNLYFLAMCHHRLGHAAEAKNQFERAEATRKSPGLDPAYIRELDDFRAEAQHVLTTPPER